MTDLSAPLPPVIDTSPLIFLTKAQHLELLQLSYSTVLVPKTVAFEIRQYGPTDITWQSLQNKNWLKTVEVPFIPKPIQVCAVDPGESAVLAWAYQNPGTEAILDDLAGRHCALKLGIPIRGTLGVVLAAKKKDQIKAARPIITELKQAGMYLSDRVINQALAMVGE